MGVGCALLTEVKLTHTTNTLGTYRIPTSSPRRRQAIIRGGVALLWKEGDNLPGVEAARIMTPNLLTFQLVTDIEQFYVMGIYIPPNDSSGVDDLSGGLELVPR